MYYRLDGRVLKNLRSPLCGLSSHIALAQRQNHQPSDQGQTACFSFVRFVLAIAGIRRLVVQIKTIEKDDLIAL